MNLILDAGNTSLKAALFEKGVLKDQLTIPYDNPELFLSWLKDRAVSASILASVTTLPVAFERPIGRLPNLCRLQADTALPIRNEYQAKNRLGMDRLANAVGAYSLYPSDNVLVIDAGTCLKFDLVEAGGTYRGGAISPGMLMRFKSLHSFTDRLPMVEPEPEVDLIGTTTESSIRSGVLYGMQTEITGVMALYRERYTSLHCILTGGDSRYFLNLSKSGIFVRPSLTLLGLDAILQHNQ